MKISEQFKGQFFFNRLQHRKETFLKMFEHLEKYDDGNIIETGTLRITDNFEGDGQSTALWNWFLEQNNNNINWNVFSVDIDPKAVEISKKSCRNVSVFERDSLNFLSSLSDTILSRTRLLYLDSFDWHPDIHLDSCFHHMAELACVYAKLPKGCLIVVDDKHSKFDGKHMMIMFFFEKLGMEPVFDGYQIGWIK